MKKLILLLIPIALFSQQKFTVTAGQKIRVPVTCTSPCVLGSADTDFFLSPKDLDVGVINNFGDYVAPSVIPVSKTVFVGLFLQGNYIPQLAQVTLKVSTTVPVCPVCTGTTCPTCPTCTNTNTGSQPVSLTWDTTVVPAYQLKVPNIGDSCGNQNLFSRDSTYFYFCDGDKWRAISWTK